MGDDRIFEEKYTAGRKDELIGFTDVIDKSCFERWKVFHGYLIRLFHERLEVVEVSIGFFIIGFEYWVLNGRYDLQATVFDSLQVKINYPVTCIFESNWALAQQKDITCDKAYVSSEVLTFLNDL